MMMGPDPRTRIFEMSVRLGIIRLQIPLGYEIQSLHKFPETKGRLDSPASHPARCRSGCSRSRLGSDGPFSRLPLLSTDTGRLAELGTRTHQIHWMSGFRSRLLKQPWKSLSERHPKHQRSGRFDHSKDP